MKRQILAKRLLQIALLGLVTLGTVAASCDTSSNPSCTQCGFQAGEHIMTSYFNSEGSEIPISGYADASGCFKPFECP